MARFTPQPLAEPFQWKCANGMLTFVSTSDVLWSCCGRVVVVLWSCCGRCESPNPEAFNHEVLLIHMSVNTDDLHYLPEHRQTSVKKLVVMINKNHKDKY